jgi:hypothetical protein
MSKKRALIVSLFCLAAIISCIQPISRPDRTPEPIIIEGTLYTNPMAAIEKFAQQTAVAQTQVADPAQPSTLFITPILPNYTIEQKLLHVVFPDGRKVSYSPFELGAFPQTTIFVENQEVIGVSLLALLQQAGWDAFDVSAISLNGIGSLTIPKDQITQEYLLVLSGSSIKFISSSTSQSLWIDGLTVIEIY